MVGLTRVVLEYIEGPLVWEVPPTRYVAQARFALSQEAHSSPVVVCGTPVARVGDVAGLVESEKVTADAPGFET